MPFAAAKNIVMAGYGVNQSKIKPTAAHERGCKTRFA